MLAARLLLAGVGIGWLAIGVPGALRVLPSPALWNVVSWAARLAVVAVFLGLAWKPDAAARLLRAPTLATPRGLGAAALAAGAIYFVFGLGAFVETARLLDQIAAGQSAGEAIGEVDRTTLLVNVGLNFLIFMIPAFAWASSAEGRPEGGAAGWLGLVGGSRRWSVVWGLMAVLVVFWFLVAAGLAARALGSQEDVENERAEAIARSLDVPSALLLATLTGIGEEVFFRGFLQRKLGNAGQAVLFGLAHLNYLQVLQVVVTGALGYAFGRVRDRTGSLWGPIVGHFAFNATGLLIIIARNNGWL